MRQAAIILFIVELTLLAASAVAASLSRKPNRTAVSLLCAGLMIPVIGNLIIIISTTATRADYGFYIYFIGMDIAIYTLLNFIFKYCEIKWPHWSLRVLVYILLLSDVIQLALNVKFNHAFSHEMVMVDLKPYFRLVPYVGQSWHRIVCYGLFFASVLILTYKYRVTPKINAEKYTIILMVMLCAGLIETYYIVSKRPIDMSMIAFGVLGILIYYFAILYRPVKYLDRMLASIVSDLPEALFFFDLTGQCIWANKPAYDLVGIDEGRLGEVKQNLDFLFDGIDYDNYGWCRKVEIGEGDDYRIYYIENRPMMDDSSNVTGIFLSIRDDTENHLAMKREMYKSTHDSLTGLYAREYLLECMNKFLRTDKKSDYLVLYVNITNFNVINDVFGSEFGKKTLKHIASFLKGYIKGKAVYGMLTKHTYGIILKKENFHPDEIEERLTNFAIGDEGLEHHIEVNVGVYEVRPDDTEDVLLMLESARLATTKLTDDRPEHIAFYDDMLRDEIVYDQLISNQLHDAIRERQIRPYLQPIVNSTGTLVGAEALVRWIHPDDGFLSPAAFIPVFEKNGLIAEVDKHMWRCACEILADWKKRGINKFISINISPKDFYFLDVYSELMSLVKQFGIDPIFLRIEITESVMMTDSDDRLKLVSDLRDAGFIVEMDDFGSGFSSLNLLKDMSVDVLKIDMQFLKDSETNERANMIIRNIISMAEDLSIVSLTEGVETFDQFQKLAKMGCQLFQGYYFSKPLPVDEFENVWFRRRAGSQI